MRLCCDFCQPPHIEPKCYVIRLCCDFCQPPRIELKFSATAILQIVLFIQNMRCIVLMEMLLVLTQLYSKFCQVRERGSKKVYNRIGYQSNLNINNSVVDELWFIHPPLSYNGFPMDGGVSVARCWVTESHGQTMEGFRV